MIFVFLFLMYSWSVLGLRQTRVVFYDSVVSSNSAFLITDIILNPDPFLNPEPYNAVVSG